MRVLFVFFVGLLASSCVETESNIFVLEGRITQEKVDALVSLLHEGDTLRINSFGGRVDAAIELANFVFENDISVRISEACVSACAEILMVATPNVVIDNNTLIGFHGNSIYKNHLYLNYDPLNRHHCFRKNADALLEIYERTPANDQFWLEQYQTLAPHDVRFVEGEGKCGTVKYKTRASVWYPHQSDVENFIGYELGASLCNADKECVVRKIRDHYSKSKWFIVGDSLMYL